MSCPERLITIGNYRIPEIPGASLRCISLALVCGVVGLTSAASAVDDVTQWIEPAAARALLAEDGHIHVVDVRSLTQYQLGSLPGAVHLTAAELADMQPEAEAAVLLVVGADEPVPRLNGYRRVLVLQGGMDAWITAGFEAEIPRRTRPAFVIPRGLCESKKPAMTYPAEAGQ